MNIALILEKLKELQYNWESYECNTGEGSDWCDGAEDRTWHCAAELQELIELIEDNL